MCWNESVSLNTFLFSSFVLLLIMYNNYYTKYKIDELNSIWIYLFFASFIFMQLIEFFIWRNINNKFYNNLFSIMAITLLNIQPIASIMIVSNIQIRNILLIAYLCLIIPYSIYKIFTKNIHSVVGKSGHLEWRFYDNTFMASAVWFFFFLFSFIYERKWGGLIFGLVLLFISYINYVNDDTMWSMWCWAVNLIMIYYAFYLLIILPFFEKKSIC